MYSSWQITFSDNWTKHYFISLLSLQTFIMLWYQVWVWAVLHVWFLWLPIQPEPIILATLSCILGSWFYLFWCVSNLVIQVGHAWTIESGVWYPTVALTSQPTSNSKVLVLHFAFLAHSLITGKMKLYIWGSQILSIISLSIILLHHCVTKFH